MVLNYSRSGTVWVKKSKKYKSKFNLSNIKLWFTNKTAFIFNHQLYQIAKDQLINLLFTCTLTSTVFYCFGVSHPIHKGLGLALSLALYQYYIRDYFKVKNNQLRRS